MPFVTAAKIQSHRIDYVIIGGGTAGLVLAARLTEDPNVTVLVIEAGTHHVEEPVIDVPGYMGRGIANPKLDWTFLTVPQKRANNNVVLQPRGKGLGGSSHANFLGMFRPSKEELDALEVLGNKGWNWDSLLHYTKKSETYVPVPISDEDAEKYAIKLDPTLHGTDGPLKKSFTKEWPKIHESTFLAAESLGVPKNPEPSGGRNLGAVSALISVDPVTAKRSYASPAYLEPNLHRSNLLVLIEAHVTKIIFEEAAGLQKAVGVEFLKDGTVHRVVGVQREYIIAAGTFQTPQILELSGVGNPDILHKFGIKPLVDLPGVGENLQDHVGVSTIVEVKPIEVTVDDLVDPELAKKHEELYKEKQEGFYAMIPASGNIFLSAEHIGSDSDVKNWQEHMHTQSTETLAKVNPALRSGLEKQYAIQRELFASKEQAQAEVLQYVGHQPVPYAKFTPGKHYNSFFCALMHPLSRGSVHLASSDPLASPAIDPNYFANEADLDLVVHTIEFALKLNKTPPLDALVIGPHIPSKEVLEKGKAGLEEYVKANCGPVFHPVGTASMLPREDGGVVDATLKVYGTSNVRVVDASILPMELSCHIQSLTYAIGEKAADILKSEHFPA
ncbi:GMC oxidoreductase [Schizopora paradoxa]|uniref:GMC oxidoreductase n=1 Tax=Schizopora paradoxa TaxID=27342 RepID=A0A0H2S4L8_9AGAM|nr:GMC oxidoreductase [Schizopora paradoxa]